MDIKTQKTRARLQAKKTRAAANHSFGQVQILEHVPADIFKGHVIGGYWPLPGELDIRPLLEACYGQGHKLALPCTPRKGKPLTFRAWSPSDVLKAGPYGTREPFPEKPEMQPSLVLVPLLAFTKHGERLGYGGGFYDRTLARLKEHGEVFACGIAYAGQEAASLPVDEYDYLLDGILTDQYFKAIN
ncbi:5-formyltetrahydrofolate cyclo-ligase [Hellea balneolensis]|uniref:5-formyltetrahydrofolate cyclo-ligase n=1 Tax=Hellea balneolensis TaxID=287478 RepID=UPI0004225150|nr:5-formyltetrahydrofolate cyclo-ligase [Hellea balneolensis]